MLQHSRCDFIHCKSDMLILKWKGEVHIVSFFAYNSYRNYNKIGIVYKIDKYVLDEGLRNKSVD